MVSRSPRSLRALIVLFTVGALLAMPLPAAGGKPRGTQGTLEVSALTSAVSVGQSAAFGVVFRNNGPSMFTHVRLSGIAPGASLESAPAGCSGSATSVTCSFDKLMAGQSLSLLFVFGAPASAGSVPFSAVVKVDSGNNNQSAASDDTFSAAATAAVIDSPNFFGGWQAAHGSPVSFATAAVSGANHQSSSVNVPPVDFGYPAALDETDDAIVCSGSPLGGIGQTVDLAIANGEPVDPYLTLTLTYDKVAAAGKTPWTISFVHQTDDGVCHFPPRGCKHNHGFCFDAWWVGSGWHKKLILRVELPSNGRGKGL
jgi:hypothetical protein